MNNELAERRRRSLRALLHATISEGFFEYLTEHHHATSLAAAALERN